MQEKILLLRIHGTSNNSGIITYYLVVSVDGLPFFNHSSNVKLQPILVSIYQCEMRPLCAGVYFKKSKNRKMPSPEILMKQFLDDINDLQTYDINCNGV